MKHFILILVVSIVSIAASQARLGETKEQCTARYGPAIKVNRETDSLFFRKNGLTVMASFYEGKCHSIAYIKVETDALGQTAEFSDVEKTALMEANSAGKAWSKRKAISLNSEWESDGGAVLAVYETLGHMLIVLTHDQYERETAAKAAEEKKKLEGF